MSASSCDALKANGIFFGICIPIRFLIAYGVKRLSLQYLPYVGMITLFQAIGISSIYVFQLRANPVETFGCPLWWNDVRPVHGALYMATAIYALTLHRFAYIPLMVDALLGFLFKWYQLYSMYGR
jgi:hypothetical protein